MQICRNPRRNSLEVTKTMARRVLKKLPTIGRASRFEAFNPDAIDGDNDGIVQELTRFERPATARTISGAMSKPFDINQPVPEIIDALINDPSLYDLAPQKIPSVIFEMAGGDRELFERSRIRNVTPKGQWSEKRIMELVNGIKIEPSPDGIFTIVAPPIPEIRELIGFDGDFSNVRIPSPEARIRIYKAILENLKENKNEKRAYAETISEKLYKKADNGMFLPRMEYNDMRESLGEQYMPGTPFHPFDAIYERFLRLSNDMMFGAEMNQMEYVQVMHDFYGHFGTGRGFDRHGEWANYLAMVHAAETVSEGDDEIIDQIAFAFFDRIMTSQLAAWEEVDEKRGISTAQEAQRLIWEIIQREHDTWVDRDTMRQIIGIDDPLTYSRPKTKSLSEKTETIKKRAVAYLHSIVDNNVVETGQTHSSFVTKKNPAVEEKSLRRFNRFDRFDPNAIDADGDGKVQDATRFERPGLPRAPKTPRLTGAMARPRTMDERNKKIVEKYNSGQTARQIAKEFGMNEEAVEGVLKVMRRRGETLRAPLTESVQGQQEEARKLFDEGKTYSEIGYALGLTRRQAYNLIRKYGEGRQKQRSIGIKERNAKILEMFDSGKTRQEIADEFDITRGRVNEVLLENGRKRRVKPKVEKENTNRLSRNLEKRRAALEVLGSEFEAARALRPTPQIEPLPVVNRTVRAPKEPRRTPKKPKPPAPKTRKASPSKDVVPKKKEPRPAPSPKPVVASPKPVVASPKPVVATPKPTPPIFIPEGIPESSRRILQDYDAGKTVLELAKERNMKTGDILQTLVKYRLPDKSGRMTIPRSSGGLKGSIGRKGRKKSMQKYIDNPRLDIDAETIAESIGFWRGFSLGSGRISPDSYNYANHPQFSYDLQTGKPVVILGSRTDSAADIEKIIKEGKYLIRKSGTYGLGGNFGFDGDPIIGEVYEESLGVARYPGTLARVNRLIVKLKLRNPIVYNVGILEGLEDFAYNSEMFRYKDGDETGPRENRITNLREQTNEFIKQLGGEKKVRGLYKKLLETVEKEVSLNSFDDSWSANDAIERLNRYAKIVEGGDIGHIGHRDFNRLARAAGHDAIVRLAIGHWEPDTSHIIVLDERSIKIVGKRPAYNKETIEAEELRMVNRFIEMINSPNGPFYPGFLSARDIKEYIANIEKLLLDKEANPDSWTEVDDNSIIRQARYIFRSYGMGQAEIKFAEENGIETSEEIKNTLEEGLQIALATNGLKRKKGNKLSGSIRRAEPEVWEMPEDDLIPFDAGDYDNELEGGALYDEMIGPKPKVNRPNDRKPLTLESATQRRTALIAGGFVNLDDEIQVRDGKSISQQAREAIARDFAEDKLSLAEILKKYKVGESWLRKHFPEMESKQSRNRRRNDSIRQDFLDGATIDFLSNKYNISPRHLRRNIVSDLLKERGDTADAQESYKDQSNRRTNRRSRKNSKKTSKTKPNPSESVGPNKDTTADVPTEPLITPGGISGSMSNENFNVGLTLKTKLKISPLENGLFKVEIDYGDLTISAEVDLDNYSSYKDAYDRWIDWDGNYGMRVASSALMGENLPEAWGYRGTDDGTHHHDVISTGVMVSGAKESLSTVEKQVTDALIALHHINTGKETNIRPIYRGISNITAGNELLSMGSGSIVTLPLSAFTADRKVANMYATAMGTTNDGLILEVLPGARVGDAAGDQYLHRFDLLDDKGNVEGSAIDVTESITQGRFKFVKMSTILVANQSGGNDSVKKITLEQIETFNPVKGSYEKNSGRLSGSMSSKRDQFLARLGDVRPITQGLVPEDVQSLQARAIEMYVQRSPTLIRQLSDIEARNSWQTAADAINPDGSRMSKEQYIAFKTNEMRQIAQQYASRRLNKYDPDTRPRHLEQLQHNVDLMFAASPELQMLCEQYGYPLYAIFNAQEVRDKDGKPVWKPNAEAHEKNMPGTVNGITLMGLSISAIHPYSDDAFIPEGMLFGQAIQDQRRLLNGHWGIRPEAYGTGVDTDPLSLHKLLIEQHMSEYEKLGRRPDLTDSNTPLGTLRHETSHSIHSGMLARALLDVLENPSIETRERYALLSLMLKPNWQAAIAASAGSSKQVQMMYDQAVSDYAASSPPEWFAETLSAALSPSEKTRALLNFNHRGILAFAIPELRKYLIEGDWP